MVMKLCIVSKVICARGQEDAQDHGCETSTEEAKEGKPFFAGIEAVIVDEYEGVGLEKKIDDTVDERHVYRDSNQHRLKTCGPMSAVHDRYKT